jgi:hypothetical protein
MRGGALRLYETIQFTGGLPWIAHGHHGMYVMSGLRASYKVCDTGPHGSCHTHDRGPSRPDRKRRRYMEQIRLVLYISSAGVHLDQSIQWYCCVVNA